MALVRLQLRRDTAANWTAANPVLANGEPGLETDTGKVKYGNGTQNWAALPYATNTPLASSAPPAIGTASAGTSSSAARADHSHAIPSSLSVQSLSTAGDVTVGGGLTVSGSLTATKLSTTASSITDLVESVQDIVGDTVKAGDGINVVYNDVAGTLTVSAAGGSGTGSSLTLEQVDDRVAALLKAGDGINLAYDDGNNLLTISADDIDGGPVPPGPAPNPEEFRILTSPVGVDTEATSNATFTVAATGGTGTYTYQWQRMIAGSGTWNNVSNGANYSGATTAKLTVLNIPASFNRSWFRCAVTNGSTTRYSAGARLDVNYFEITAQPTSTTATAGSTTPSTTFSVTAISDDPITYQWQLLSSGSWGNVSGATSSTYGSISATAPGDGSGFYAYRCAVTSNGVTLYTDQVTLGVLQPPVTVTTQPSPQTASAGAATFTVAYTGGTSPTVQWQVQRTGQTSWENIAGATTTTLSLVNLVMEDGGNLYRAVITSGTTVVFSNSAALTVPGPIIVIQPVDAIANLGAASFSFTYTGGSGSVQWWRRSVGSVPWTAITGQTGTTISLTGLIPADSGKEYSATVTVAGITVRTRAALLTVTADVFFSQQPQPVTVTAGQTATFSFNTTFAASDTRTVSWWVRNAGSSAWLPILSSSGAQNSFYTIGPSQPFRPLTLVASMSLSGNSYRAIVYRGAVASTAVESVTSESALLTVNQAQAVIADALPPARPLGMTRSNIAAFAYGRGTIIGVSTGGPRTEPSSLTGGIPPLPPAYTSPISQASQRIDRPTSTFIYSRDDGASWELGSLPVAACWFDIAFGAGRFVAVGCDSEQSGKAILAVSDDAGASWTSRVFHDGTFVTPRIAGSNDAGFIISAGGRIFQGDGWSLTDRGLGTFSDAVRFGNLWVRLAVTIQYSSDNGATWTAVPYASYTGTGPYSLASSGTRVVALAKASTTAFAKYLYSSTNGTVWEYQPLTFEPQCSSITGPTQYDTSAAVSVAMSSSELFYVGFSNCTNSASFATQAQNTQVIHRAPASAAFSASAAYTSPESKPYQVSNSHLIVTDRYVVAIAPFSGSVVRLPVVVTGPALPPPDDGRPFAPQQVTASAATATTVSVSWVEPTSSGAASITDYRVDYSSNSGQTWTTFSRPASTALSATVTGLTTGTSYVFRVSAINSYGTGPASFASNAASASGVPASAPLSVAAAQIASPMGNRLQPSFSLTWQPPSSIGGSAVTGYIVQQRIRRFVTDPATGQREAWGEWTSLPPRNTTTPSDGAYYLWATVSGTTATVSNIEYTAGVSREFQHRVAAVNAAGPGAWGEGNSIPLSVGR